MIAAVKKAWTKSGRRIGEIKTMTLYVKPEENAVYYVINGIDTGAVPFLECGTYLQSDFSRYVLFNRKQLKKNYKNRKTENKFEKSEKSIDKSEKYVII